MTELKLTEPMTHGLAVKRVQEMCESLGFDPGPVDGWYGLKTAKAVYKLRDWLDLSRSGVYDKKTERALKKRLADEWLGTQRGSNATQFIDISGVHSRPKNFSHKRRWRDIDGVTLHQTGCSMPLNPMGWQRVNAHYGLLFDGTVVLINDPTDMIWHAQGLSHHTIGVEISGNYQGVDGQDWSRWKPGGGPHHLTPEMSRGAELMMRDIYHRLVISGSEWRYLYAHRQSSGTRTADPGEEIWKQIALKWAEATGADILPDYYRGKGKPLPYDWCEDYGSKYIC
jgi:hypothetical protein